MTTLYLAKHSSVDTHHQADEQTDVWTDFLQLFPCSNIAEATPTCSEIKIANGKKKKLQTFINPILCTRLYLPHNIYG